MKLPKKIPATNLWKYNKATSFFSSTEVFPPPPYFLGRGIFEENASANSSPRERHDLACGKGLSSRYVETFALSVVPTYRPCRGGTTTCLWLFRVYSLALLMPKWVIAFRHVPATEASKSSKRLVSNQSSTCDTNASAPCEAVHVRASVSASVCCQNSHEDLLHPRQGRGLHWPDIYFFYITRKHIYLGTSSGSELPQ